MASVVIGARKFSGVYEYPNVPKDVYRRHERCTCTLEYFPGKGKKQNVWTKKWTDDDKIRKRIKFSEKEDFNNLKEQRKAKYFAKKSIEKTKFAEKTITNDLKDIESKIKSKLVGLEFRIKSEESLSRKIISDSKEKNISLKEADDLITDKLRYTFVNSEDVFTNNYFKVVNLLKQQGYKVIRVKNTFKDGAVYKGINTLVESKDKFIFELQYHTPKSIEIKENGLHKLYEQQRILDKIKDKEKWDKLEEKMIKLSDTISIPKNVRRIK